MQNWISTVLSQYGNSPRLLALIEKFSDAIDPATDIDAFFANVWNIDTASGYGLDVWGRIVGVTRALSVPTAGTITFGFHEAGDASALGFGQASFYGSLIVSANFNLPDADFRRLILVKAFANVSDRSIPSFNIALLALFPGRGNAYIVDSGSMTARLTFGFPLTPVDIAVLTQSGVLPGPTGVLIGFSDIDPTTVFGFVEAGSGFAGFGHGSFTGGSF